MSWSREGNAFMMSTKALVRLPAAVLRQGLRDGGVPGQCHGEEGRDDASKQNHLRLSGMAALYMIGHNVALRSH